MRLAAVLLLCPTAGRLLAQEPLETKLVVEQRGREIGREEFTLVKRGPGPEAFVGINIAAR